MIAIIDYGAGNLKSVQKALDALGHENQITSDPQTIEEAERILLPGVGAFGDAMKNLVRSGMDGVVRHSVALGKPFMGICVGMQLLFDSSEEDPGVEGLGIIPGKVCKIRQEGLKIPQMGWNSLKLVKKSKLFEGIPQGEYVYFVHSYYPSPANKEDVAAVVTYGSEITVAVEHGNVFATQFHPEKSGQVGLKLLDNFAKIKV